MHSTLNVNRQRAREQQQQFAVGELERQSRRDQDSFCINVFQAVYTLADKKFDRWCKTTSNRWFETLLKAKIKYSNVDGTQLDTLKSKRSKE